MNHSDDPRSLPQALENTFEAEALDSFASETDLHTGMPEPAHPPTIRNTARVLRTLLVGGASVVLILIALIVSMRRAPAPVVETNDETTVATRVPTEPPIVRAPVAKSPDGGTTPLSAPLATTPPVAVDTGVAAPHAARPAARSVAPPEAVAGRGLQFPVTRAESDAGDVPIAPLPMPAAPDARTLNEASEKPEPIAPDANVAEHVDSAAIDRAAIMATLDVYRRSYNTLDAAAVFAIWVGVDRRGLQRAFSTLRSQEVSFDRCELTLEVDRAQARCTGSLTYVPTIGPADPQVRAVSWTLDLQRSSNRWLIENVVAR